MHVIGQINNNLIIINLNSMGLLSLLDNGLSYKNFKQQSQHIIQMYVKKQEVLVHSWIKESPLLFCFVCLFFFLHFSLQAWHQESQKIWTRDRKICLKRQSYIYMKPEKLDWNFVTKWSKHVQYHIVSGNKEQSFYDTAKERVIWIQLHDCTCTNTCVVL